MNDQVPFKEKIAQRHLTLLQLWSKTMTRARPFHLLIQDCPPNTMVEQNCQKV